MSERSILELRTRPHIQAGRENDTVVQVLRDGEVVATVYGTREGLQIVSERIPSNSPASLGVLTRKDLPPVHSWVIPLLAPDELCPHCGGTNPDCAICAQTPVGTP